MSKAVRERQLRMAYDNDVSIPVEQEYEVKVNVLGMLIKGNMGSHSVNLWLYNAYCGRQALPSGFVGNSQAVKKLLYNQRDIVEVRMLCGKLYAFVREPVPAGFQEHREIVLRYPRHVSKVNGVAFAGPLKEECSLINMEQLVPARTPGQSRK